MKLNKPKFWDTKKSLISILLFPISLIFISIIFIKRRFVKTINFNIPIICVGNIYVGGTGKTPASILLAHELKEIGKNPVILKKFYSSHQDEHSLIKESHSKLILSENRVNGVKQAIKEGYNTVIMDDGFQDCRIKKDLNIICFNQRQLIGNGMIIPAGPLRESLESLNLAEIVLINGNKDEYFEEKILTVNNKIKIFYSQYVPTNLDHFKDKKLIAIAGIGNPTNFFQLVEENGLKIEKKLIYPDHYIFNDTDVQEIKNKIAEKNYKIITTEKDYHKMKKFDFKELDYLKVSLEINEKEKFLQVIKGLYAENN